MSENFTIEIISPDKSVLKSEASEVTIPAYEGQMGILRNHIPLVTFLKPGLIINPMTLHYYLIYQNMIQYKLI